MSDRERLIALERGSPINDAGRGGGHREQGRLRGRDLDRHAVEIDERGYWEVDVDIGKVQALRSDRGALLDRLDRLDIRILTELQKDGSISNVELARRVHLSPSPCLTRVKALESAGVIERYVALANAKLLGLSLNVFISISLRDQSKKALEEFERSIAEYDQVMECYLMTGESDYLIRVMVSDIEALERFISQQLTPLSGIEKIRSSFALKQVRYKTQLPLAR